MINTTTWNNYHITYVSECGFNALRTFKDFLKKSKKNKTSNWKLVGHHDIPETAGPEYTWIVSFGSETEGGNEA